MLKTTLIAAAAASFVAFGATAADAKPGHGGGHDGGKHGGGHHGNGHHRGAHHGGHGKHKFNRYPFWLNYSWYPRCHYETRKVYEQVRGRHGRIYYKPVYRNVKVCD